MLIGGEKVKKSRKWLKIVLPSVAIIAGLAIVAFFFGRPLLKYLDAKEEMENRNYTEAEQMFESLGGFFDSQNLHVECRYLQALRSCAKQEYNTARELFISLGSYKDAETYVKKCYSQNASESDFWKCVYNGNYDQAKMRIGYVHGNTIYLNNLIDYLKAEEEVKKGNYQSAVEKFTGISPFADAKVRASETKMKYINQSGDKTDDHTVYNYLTQLIEEDYPGAKAKYDQLYTPKVKLFYNTTKDGTDQQTSLSRWKAIYFHVELSGLKPDEEIQLFYSA